MTTDPAFAAKNAAKEDYSDFLFTTNVGEITQLTDAPTDYQLNPLPVLADTDNFDTWMKDATRILRQKNLHRFVDADIERPKRSDTANAPKWVKISRDIQAWLYQSVSKEINMLVESRNFRCDFADEYVEALKQALDATGYNAARNDCIYFLQLDRS